ncbi:uncharacterized protein M6B38_273440 [Iris pallida]|uniref:Transposase n=1 Tax=Iris pallida TaxID=29817 RepID=A0AAX6ES92_IRIPA|nr:uncharacterized protein M6B38_106485 [Iris pallida]KAJ6848263.1 uncharacterized protein M6B38_273440 [Iris pallida]
MSGDGVNRVNSAGNTSTRNHVDDNHASGGSQGNTIIENQSDGSQGNTSPLNQSGTQKIIIFNEYGQPVDIGSTQFSSAVGMIAKAHCPPGIEDWRRVPKNIKEDIWKSVKNEYQVPEIYKDKILKKANSAWRNWKRELRKICDRVETVAERKSIVVEAIKKEDWEAFVDLHSTNEDQARRDSGRNARKKVKILHTTGRKVVRG